MYHYDNLVGQKHDAGTTDCYSIVRDFYQQNFDIELPNYARPTDWWNAGYDLYAERYFKNGFRPLDVHPSEWQYGDVFLMAVMSPVSNHAAVLVDNGKILHHFTNRLSTVEPYKGIWRNCTTAVLRHKDVVIQETTETVNLIDILPPSTRRKLDAITQTTTDAPVQ